MALPAGFTGSDDRGGGVAARSSYRRSQSEINGRKPELVMQREEKKSHDGALSPLKTDSSPSPSWFSSLLLFSFPMTCFTFSWSSRWKWG